MIVYLNKLGDLFGPSAMDFGGDRTIVIPSGIGFEILDRFLGAMGSQLA